jgi:inositol-pentakisphosphate 2-kinase
MYLAGHLLRVQKDGIKAHSYGELQEYWEEIVKPLFEPEDLIQHRLIKIEDGAVIPRLNAILAQIENARRPDFRGSRAAIAAYGMLVEDMRESMICPAPMRLIPRDSQSPILGHPDDLTLEFKPKWLAQSPNAPASATRCRNCAREALKHHTKLNGCHQTQPTTRARRILCPFDFLTCASCPNSLSNIVAHLSPLDSLVKPQATASAQHNRLVQWLQTNTMLPRLRAAQLANDHTGPLCADAHDPDFQLAMTLRDCTCFVRIPADPALRVEAKLGDLDKKNWAAKLGYWQAIERRLIEGGYYEGREVPRVETDCQLERGLLPPKDAKEEGGNILATADK